MRVDEAPPVVIQEEQPGDDHLTALERHETAEKGGDLPAKTRTCAVW